MADFLQQVVSGLASGGVYALLALALVLIYRSTGVINFAQGEMAMFSTFICWELTQRDVPYWGAFFLTLAISFAGGVAIERLIIRPVENAPVLTVVTVTIGLLILLNNAAAWIWKGQQRLLESPFPKDTYDIGGVVVAAQDIGIIAVSLALVAVLWLLFQRTTIGLRCARPRSTPSPAVSTACASPGCSRSGGGSRRCSAPSRDPRRADPGQLRPEPDAADPDLRVRGRGARGLDSPLGAVVGGLALGVVLNLIGAYIDFFSDLRTPAALILILVVLLVRPVGLFGRAVARRV